MEPKKGCGASLATLILGMGLGFAWTSTVAAHKYPGPEPQGLLFWWGVTGTFFVIGHLFNDGLGRICQILAAASAGMMLSAMVFPQ